MPRRTSLNTLTRLLLAWLIVCVGCLGLLPAMAAQPLGAQAMDELCSVAMGLASADADTGNAAKASGVSGHEHCSICVVATVAPAPAITPVVLSAPADFHVRTAALAPHGAPPAALWQARGPPAQVSR